MYLHTVVFKWLHKSFIQGHTYESIDMRVFK